MSRLNPYEVLGVSPSMSEVEIKSRYRKLVKMYHPDASGGNPTKFMEIQKAWEDLKSLGDRAFGRKIGRPTHVSLFRFRRI